jgi:hypothetical protein
MRRLVFVAVLAVSAGTIYGQANRAAPAFISLDPKELAPTALQSVTIRGVRLQSGDGERWRDISIEMDGAKIVADSAVMRGTEIALEGNVRLDLRPKR